MKTFLLTTVFRERKSLLTSSKKNFNHLDKEFNTQKTKDFTFKDKERIVVEGQSNPDNIDEICRREGINSFLFLEWSEDILKHDKSVNAEIARKSNLDNQDYRFRIVLEGKNGETSVGEICKRENLTQEEFLSWTKEFRLFRKDSFTSDVSIDGNVYKLKHSIRKKGGVDVLEYIESYVDISPDSICLDASKFDASININQKGIRNIICLDKVNNIRHINKFFESINGKLDHDGIFVGCLETFQSRKKRLTISNIPVLNSIYFMIEFLFKRIFPKLSLTKKYYFDFTKGNDRLLSKAEGLGRLVSCGFKIMDFKSINGLLYFIVKKDKDPCYDLNPSYGPVYAMPRLGKGGEIIKVYKFRTMHPYSEYLQDYMIRVNGYANTGKPADDFRIPTWGKFMRKFWLDELPQLLNLLKGEMKLVGIRPVTERYFKDIPKEMQRLRLTQKPGCIPPYVALNREGNVMSVLQSEKEYLVEKIRHPFITDTKYFFKALYNIIFNNKRSA